MLIPMKDLEERVIIQLREGESSINSLQRAVGCNKNKLIVVCKKLVKGGFLSKKEEGTKTLLSLKNVDVNLLTDGFYYIENTEKLIKDHVNALKKLKSQHKALEQINDQGISWLHPEAKEHLDLIIDLLNSLNDISTSYTYLNYFNLGFEHSQNKIRQIKKRCEETTRSTIKQIIKNYHKTLLNSYIYWSICRHDQLLRLQNYFNQSRATR